MPRKKLPTASSRSTLVSPAMVRAIAFPLLLLGFVSRASHAQRVWPDTLPLSEQFRMHYFIDDSIIAALPGYVDFDHTVCEVVVHLVDTLHWADSARALFRYVLPEDSSELSQQYCGGHPEVLVRSARYARGELRDFVMRIDSVIREPALGARGGAWSRGDTLIVMIHSKAALERVRTRLARERSLPHSMISYRVQLPEEVDGPVSPPDSAYLAVLDAIAAAPPERSRPFVIDLHSLPSTIKEVDLRSRGLRPRVPSDSCQPITVVSFQRSRQYVSGAYGFSTTWRLNDYYFEVRCVSGTCLVTRSGQLPGDKLSVGCPRGQIGPDKGGRRYRPRQ